MKIISCSPRSQCRQWKKCAYCAKLRQAQIASVAQSGSSTSRAITYAVVRPLSNDIAKQKTQLLKDLNKKVDGGIWTIETGKEVAGVHANIIIGSDKPIHAATIASSLTSAASVYAEQITHADIRNVAAYVSKPEAFPSAQEYTGRLYGSFGTWKRPLAALAENTIAPDVAAVAIDQMLADAGVPEPVSSPDKSEGEKYKYMRRVLAAYVDEVSLNGYAYVGGYGIVNDEDLRKFGLCKKNDHKQ